MKNERIELDIGFGKLVLEIYHQSDAPNPECTISLESEDNIQDICMVRKSETKPKTVECLLWTDKNDENYTHKYEIGMYEVEEESNG
jgi:hypothetical protein